VSRRRDSAGPGDNPRTPGASRTTRLRASGTTMRAAVLRAIVTTSREGGNEVSSAGALDGAAHAPRAAPATAEFAARDGEHLYAVLLQVGVRGHVPLVGHDHARLHREHVAPVVPLLPLR